MIRFKQNGYPHRKGRKKLTQEIDLGLFLSIDPTKFCFQCLAPPQTPEMMPKHILTISESLWKKIILIRNMYVDSIYHITLYDKISYDIVSYHMTSYHII